MTAGDELLRFAGVDKTHRRVKALSGLDLGIKAGEFVTLVDLAGICRTAVLRLAAGLDRPDKGRITFAGGKNMLAARHRIGAAFPDIAMPPDLTLQSGLGFSARLFGLAGAASRARIDEALERWQLRAHARDQLASLSGGDRRRAELARATLHRPDLLLLGDLTAGLSGDDAAALIADTRNWAGEGGRAVLWSTGNAAEIGSSDRVIVLRRGSVAFDGSRKSLLARSKERDIAAAVAALDGGTADDPR